MRRADAACNRGDVLIDEAIGLYSGSRKSFQFVPGDARRAEPAAGHDAEVPPPAPVCAHQRSRLGSDGSRVATSFRAVPYSSRIILRARTFFASALTAGPRQREGFSTLDRPSCR